ncbi:hypothetical protein OIE62_05725 [Streptomyces scopuliridis]|uniref:Uncharacterized protein n=1 Tax=Streptomyces scopuliridis TaxID=452529 RepID=A0ACD4ZZA4_9ACTN|nr:hypothetical protein [Streptomyces scopuliridis]WSC03437.1 hypothetical protein OG835_36105 [Streptomyces scopuliridis]WSC11268.1 hypothetical protein OIE62_05725 [Streptomyces scopuliridis]
MTDFEDRKQQAGISRHLLYYLNAPIAEGCRLRGVLPAPGAVRIAIRAGEGEGSDTFLYEIPHDSVAPARIPGILRAIMSDTQFYGSGDVSDVLGMTLFRLRPEEITPAPEPEEGQALRALLGLGGGPDDENPFLIGFLMTLARSAPSSSPSAWASSVPRKAPGPGRMSCRTTRWSCR